jgi:hypothetical protein
MDKNSSQQIGYTPSIRKRLAALFYTAALGLSIYAILVLRGKSFLANISNLQNNHIYVAVSSWDIPAFISVPCFIALMAILMLGSGFLLRPTTYIHVSVRMRSRVPEDLIRRLLKVAIAFAVLAIVARIVLGFSISHYMEAKGYTSCPYYSSPALMSSRIWVRSSDYCVENSGSVRKLLLNWFDSLPEFGRNVSQKDVQQKVDQLLKEYDRRERERFPELSN